MKSAQSHKFCVAPMIDWTDRHCRFFHRQLTSQSRLFTEMIVADAVLHGNRNYLLGFDACEHPVALQLGGSDPSKLAEAAKIGEEFGYDEINLNVGCPSDRVQSGAFGACLMKTPDLVAKCVAAMRKEVSIPVTVKCRIGVDDQDPEKSLRLFIAKVAEGGCSTIMVHARMAWLEGLSPKENRTIPPLNYDLVYQVKRENEGLNIGLNGGVTNVCETLKHLEIVDGVMMGRAAYETPYVLAEVDQRVFGASTPVPTRLQVVENMIPYLEAHVANGGRPHSVTRHMIGLFHGQPGARSWRRHLSVEAVKPGAGAEVLRDALAQLPAEALEEVA